METPHPADEIQKDSCATFLICLPPSMRGVPALGKNSPHSGEGDTPPPSQKERKMFEDWDEERCPVCESENFSKISENVMAGYEIDHDDADSVFTVLHFLCGDCGASFKVIDETNEVFDVDRF